MESHDGAPAAQRLPEMIRLVLADGHPIVLQGMQHLFERQPDLEILETCATARETLEAVDRLRPDVLVLDLRLPDGGGLAVLAEVAARRLPTRVVLMSGSIHEDEMAKALRLGVQGVVLKEMAAGLLVECIRKVGQGGVWLENESMSRCLEHVLRRKSSLQELKARLTPRELEILQMAASGLRNKDLAAQLAITEGTVKLHLHNIYAKLGLKNRLQLLFCARDKALV